MTEMYVQHMVDAPEGVDPDLLQYIYDAGTPIVYPGKGGLVANKICP